MEFLKQLLSRDFLLADALKAITALSVVTVAMLTPLLPKIISLPGRIL